MKQVEVKTFNAYKASDNGNEEYYSSQVKGYFNIFDYHKCIIRKKDGTIFGKFKPKEEDIEVSVRYELDKCEQLALSMFKDSEEKAKQLYDSCKRKREKYESDLVNSLKLYDEIYEGEYHECSLSPLNKCIYHFDGNEYECIFCEQPEERK